MSLTAHNLGQVAAIHIGVAPPSNTTMVWYNTTPGIDSHFVYKFGTNTWVSIGGSSGVSSLQGLTDVELEVSVPLANNQVLGYSIGSGKWSNKPISTIIGYTPVNSANTISINGVTQDLSTSRSWTIDALPSQSGNSGKYLRTNGTAASWESLVSGDITSALGYTPLNRAGDTMTGFLTLSAEPTSALHPASKSYVDNLINGLKFKVDCAAASTANVNILSAPSTLDGVTLTTGDRILLKNQTTASENGCYLFNGVGSALTRTNDSDTGSELISATFPVRGGTTNQDTWWTVTNDTIILGTTSIVFSQTGGAGTYVNGIGLSLSGNVFSLDLTRTASSSVTGLLSSTDWTTFNGKFSTPTGLNTNFLPYWNGTGLSDTRLRRNADQSINFVAVSGVNFTQLNDNGVTISGGKLDITSASFDGLLVTGRVISRLSDNYAYQVSNGSSNFYFGLGGTNTGVFRTVTNIVMSLNDNGVAIGSSTINSLTQLDLQSTTKGLGLNLVAGDLGTTRNGLVWYDIVGNLFKGVQNSSVVNLLTSSGLTTNTIPRANSGALQDSYIQEITTNVGGTIGATRPYPSVSIAPSGTGAGQSGFLKWVDNGSNIGELFIYKPYTNGQVAGWYQVLTNQNPLFPTLATSSPAFGMGLSSVTNSNSTMPTNLYTGEIRNLSVGSVISLGVFQNGGGTAHLKVQEGVWWDFTTVINGYMQDWDRTVIGATANSGKGGGSSTLRYCSKIGNSTVKFRAMSNQNLPYYYLEGVFKVDSNGAISSLVITQPSANTSAFNAGITDSRIQFTGSGFSNVYVICEKIAGTYYGDLYVTPYSNTRYSADATVKYWVGDLALGSSTINSLTQLDLQSTTKGLGLNLISGDLGLTRNGLLWYDTISHQPKMIVNGVVTNLLSSGGSGIATNGTSVTTAAIPFAEGITIANNKLIKSSTANGNLYITNNSTAGTDAWIGFTNSLTQINAGDGTVQFGGIQITLGTAQMWHTKSAGINSGIVFTDDTVSVKAKSSTLDMTDDGVNGSFSLGLTGGVKVSASWGGTGYSLSHTYTDGSGFSVGSGAGGSSMSAVLSGNGLLINNGTGAVNGDNMRLVFSGTSMRFNATGSIGIGTDPTVAPSASCSLDLQSSTLSLGLNRVSANPSATRAGQILWSTVRGRFEGSNGTSFIGLNPRKSFNVEFKRAGALSYSIIQIDQTGSPFSNPIGYLIQESCTLEDISVLLGTSSASGSGTLTFIVKKLSVGIGNTGTGSQISLGGGTTVGSVNLVSTGTLSTSYYRNNVSINQALSLAAGDIIWVETNNFTSWSATDVLVNLRFEKDIL